MGYSEESIRLAQELRNECVDRLVNDFGYTVWSDVKTHRVQTQRPSNYAQGYYCTKNHSQGYMQSARTHWHPGVPRVEKTPRNFWEWLTRKLGR